MRPSSDHDRTRLKAASRAAVTAAGTAKQLCASTRVSEAQVSRYQGAAYDEFMPLDVILDCELLAGQPILTAALADMQGYRLVSIEAEAESAGLTIDHVLDAFSSVAGLVDAYREAKRDGRIDAAEERDITNRLNEGIKLLQDGLRAHGRRGA